MPIKKSNKKVSKKSKEIEHKSFKDSSSISLSYPNKTKLWASRFSKPTNRLMEEFNASLPFDKRLYAEDLEGSRAHAKMLLKIGVLTKLETKTILSGLDRVEKKFHFNQFSFSNEEEDIHTKVENELRKIIGDLAGKLHTGRSRNDQSNLDMRLYLRSQIDVIINQLSVLMNTLVNSAQKHIHTVMPGMTHFQPAQVISYGYYIMAYFFMFARDLERFKQVRSKVNSLPLGAGALAGVNYPSDREFLKTKLQFEHVIENGMDAVSSRDHILEFHSAVAILMTNLSRLSEELIIFSNPQFGFVKVDEQYATGSSIMPNKVNPDSLELVRGKSGRILGSMLGLFTTMKGLPLAYNKDFQEDKESLFDTVDTITKVLPVMNGVMGTLTIYPIKMKEACENGYLQATDIADYLVKKGLPFRAAHEVSAKIVKHLEKSEKTYNDLSLDDYQKFNQLFSKDIFPLLDLNNQIKAKQSPGSTSPVALKKQIAKAKKILYSFKQFQKRKHQA